MSCSGLAPGASSNRVRNEYSPLIPYSVAKVPLPPFSPPFHSALALAGMTAPSLSWVSALDPRVHVDHPGQGDGPDQGRGLYREHIVRRSGSGPHDLEAAQRLVDGGRQIGL